MQVPGFLWTAILALLPLIITWLGGDYFAEQAWVPWVVLVLGFVAKAIEQARADGGATPRLRVVGEGDSSKLRRFLLG